MRVRLSPGAPTGVAIVYYDRSDDVSMPLVEWSRSCSCSPLAATWGAYASRRLRTRDPVPA
ncbi:hypothetical protein [Nocardioides bigeumensis]|uniref:hypothetical protein n=1 Tax=Nocardioides bigeumensis TaxID=433657 RepID=UPI0031D04786